MAPRVLHVIGGGDTGGAMSHLLPLLSALERAGCDVHLLCLGGGGLADEAERRSIDVEVLPMMGAYDARILRSLRRVLGERGPGGSAAGVAAPWDVVHTHGMRANLPVRLAIRGLRDRPCLFTTVHSDLKLDYESRALGRAYSQVDRASLGPVDGLLCVSDSLRRLLAGRGYPGQRLVTVRSGLEQADLRRAGEARGRPAGERPRLGTTTRLVAVKDVELLLETASFLRRTHPSVELVVMGDGPERGRLEARATELGLRDAVIFTGRVADVPERLRDLDVFLITSLYEGGVSMSVLEAMAAGLPVVVTAAGGVEEAVVDGETGFVVARDRERGALAAALAERAATLLDDPALRARMGAAGALRVRAEFTVERTAALTIRAYERCLAARGRS